MTQRVVIDSRYRHANGTNAAPHMARVPGTLKRMIAAARTRANIDMRASLQYRHSTTRACGTVNLSTRNARRTYANALPLLQQYAQRSAKHAQRLHLAAVPPHLNWRRRDHG